MENKVETTVEEVVEQTPTPEEVKPSPTEAALQKEIDNLKKRLSAVNSESAEYKRQLKAKMTEDERKEAERLEADKARDEELATLRREKTVNGYKARLMEVGYDAETAATMAEGLPSDLADEFFTAQKNFLENKAKQIQADLVKNQPNLSTGKPMSSADVEESEMAKLRKAFGL